MADPNKGVLDSLGVSRQSMVCIDLSPQGKERQWDYSESPLYFKLCLKCPIIEHCFLWVSQKHLQT